MKAVSCAIQPGILFQLTLPLRGEYTWNALPPLSPPLPPPLLPPHLVLVGPMEHNNTTRQHDELSLIPRTVWELPSFPGQSGNYPRSKATPRFYLTAVEKSRIFLHSYKIKNLGVAWERGYLGTN